MKTDFIKNKKAKNILSAFIMQVVFLVFLFLSNNIYVNANEVADEEDEYSGTITFAAHKDDSLMITYVKKFERRHPNVTVNYIYLKNYEEEMAALFENDSLPDVFFVPGVITEDKYESTLAVLGDIEELKKKYNYLEKSINKDGYVYGLPSFTYVNGFIYNKEVFAEAGISQLPKTIDDFLADCASISKYTKATPFYSNYNDKWALSYWATYPFIEMTGSNLYRHRDYLVKPYPFSPGKPHYEVYKLLYDLVKNGYCERIEKSKYGDGSYQLKTGEVGCMAMGSWAVKEIQGEKDILGFMPFPNNIDGKQYVTLSTDYSYGVSAKSENLAVAKAFVQFMIEDSGYAYGTGNISINKSDLYPDYLADLSDVTILYDSYVGYKETLLLNKLKSAVDPESSEEIGKIIEAAAGLSGKTFEDIMVEWNMRWEKGRPANFTIDSYEDVGDAINFVDLSNNELELSTAEITFINNKKELNVGYLRDYAPFSYEKDGEFTGLTYGICKRIEEMSGLKLNYIGFDTPEDILEALANRTIDIEGGTYKVDVNKLKYSKSYFEVLNVYVINKDKNISDIDLLREISTIKYENYKDKDVIFGENIKDCFSMIENGDADYMVTNYYLAQYYMDEMGTSNLEIKPGPTYSTFHFAVSNVADPSIMAIVNKVLYSIKAQDIQVMLLEYNTPSEPPLTIERIITTNPILFVSIVLIIVGLILLSVIIILIHRIINNRRRNFEYKKYKMISSLTDEYMFDYDYKKHIFKFDSKFYEAFGFPDEVKINSRNRSTELDIFINNVMIDNGHDKEVNKEPFELVKKNQEKIWFKVVSSTIYNKLNQPVYLVGKMINVQEEMENMEKAGTDELTKIYNRRGFYEAAPAIAKNVSFVMVDIDNFKGVNDSLGHDGGDAVLCYVVEKIKKVLGEHAYVGRYGGDEFMITTIDTPKKEVDDLLKKLVEETDTNFNFEGKSHKISISAGAIFEEDEIEVATLFAKADDILYEKKNSGKNGYILK